MNLKTVALIALIASVLMLLLNVYTLIESIGYVGFDFRFGYHLGVIANILFRGSLGLFFYILYKKL